MKLILGFAAALFLGVVLLIAGEVAAQGKAEKDKIRIGYAARPVTPSPPFLTDEAGFFKGSR